MVIDGEQAASLFQVSMVAYRSKYIENFSVIRGGITNTVGSQQRQAQALGDADGGLVAPFFLALVMALNFYIDILSSEDSNQLFSYFYCCRFSAMHQGRRHWSFIAAGQANQPGRILFQVIERSCALALGGLAQLEAGNQLTEILIPGAGSAEQGQARSFGNMAMR